MAVNYKKLFHLLIEKDMTNAQLQREAGFSANIIMRLKRGGYISLESVESICRVLNCGVENLFNFFKCSYAYILSLPVFPNNRLSPKDNFRSNQSLSSLGKSVPSQPLCRNKNTHSFLPRNCRTLSFAGLSSSAERLSPHVPISETGFYVTVNRKVLKGGFPCVLHFLTVSHPPPGWHWVLRLWRETGNFT